MPDEEKLCSHFPELLIFKNGFLEKIPRKFRGIFLPCGNSFFQRLKTIALRSPQQDCFLVPGGMVFSGC